MTAVPASLLAGSIPYRDATSAVAEAPPPWQHASRAASATRARAGNGDGRAAFDALYPAAVAGENNASVELARLLIGYRPARRHRDVEQALVLALQTPWADPSSLVPATVDYLLLDPDVAGAMSADARPNARPDARRLSAAAAALAGNGLFAALLQTVAVGDLRLTRLLVALRNRAAIKPPTSSAEVRLAALLALQAHLVGYLWPDARHPGAGETASVASADEPEAAGRALVNCLFRPPTPVEAAALERIAAEPVVEMLLERVRDEPGREVRIRRELARTDMRGAGATDDPSSDSSAWPRWIKQVRRARQLPAPVRDCMRGDRWQQPEILVAGCGKGRHLPCVRATFPRARITAVDGNAGDLAYAQRQCEDAGVRGIDFLANDLRDLPALEPPFDLVERVGGVRHVAQLQEECAALARCTAPTALVRVEVPSKGARLVISALRSVLRERGLTTTIADLRTLRAELVDQRYGSLPPALLESDTLCTAGGLRNLLLGGDEHELDASAWITQFQASGFEFLCAEANEPLLRAARSTGFESAAAWSIRDWERFERAEAIVFGGTYSLWFARR